MFSYICENFISLMELDEKQRELIDNIEYEVAKNFGVTQQDIINKQTRESVSNARYFIFYILHFKLGMTPRAIAREYFYNPRSVKMGYAKIKHRLKYYAYYSNILEELMEKIKPFLPNH